MNNMIKDEKFNKGVEQIKKIKMTDVEKHRILEQINNSSAYTHPVVSPWKISSLVPSFHFHKSRFVWYVGVSCLVIIFSGREIVFASKDSLPGDTLYQVKVNIIEPLSSTFAFSTKAKAEHESVLAVRRLMEAEKLASLGNLDEVKQEQLHILIESHTKALNDDLVKLSQDNSSEDVDDIVTNFQAGMNAHARVLDIVSLDEEATPQTDMSKVASDTPISKTARDNAGKVRETFKSSKVEDNNTYQKKKETIQSLIDSTSRDIDNTEKSKPEVRQAIIDNTRQTVDQAKKFLKEADTNKNKADSKSAYRSLLDSESSVKEADIFLKVGVNLKTKNTKEVEKHTSVSKTKNK